MAGDRRRKIAKFGNPSVSEMVRILGFWIGLSLILLTNLIFVSGTTNAPDVSALTVMYNSLSSPAQLTGWSPSGGDPCGQSWRGIKCLGSSVTEIRLSGLGLTGTMGYQLSNLKSVTYLDLSNNKLQGDIPYQLPPNALHINLAKNAFTGGVPYSISQMIDLQYLNLGYNHLSGQLSDMFGQLPKLSVLDLSSNSFSGDLPQSFGSLSSLTILLLQNNQFTGSINVLASLPLDKLNIQNNRFSGWIPNELKNIATLKTSKNSWTAGPAPPPPGRPQSSSSKSSSSVQENKSHGSTPISKAGKVSKKSDGLSSGAITGIVIAVLVVAGILVALLTRKSSKHFLDEEKLSQHRPFTPLVSHEVKELKSIESSSSISMRTLQISPSLGLKPPPSDRHKSFNDNDFTSKLNSKRSKNSISSTAYSLTDLKLATESFTVDSLIGEGSLGRVYRAQYTDGKVLAAKKLELSSRQDAMSEDFMEAVSGISRLHHPNITELVGYCSEDGYHILVYEFFRNGSLHEFLHHSDDYSKPLTWNTRIKIALGTARALEYLHEVCLPSAVHKNIKSSNILLDTELNPQLSDCGLAMFHQRTSQNLGVGYNAPECIKPSAYTLKSDVYSFGVVMLELLTGRKPFDSLKPRAEQSLVRWATPQLHDIDALTKMVDPALRGLYPAKSLSRFADCIALCVQPEPEFRPPMSEVVQALLRLVQRTGDEFKSSRRIDDMDHPDYPYC